MYSTSGKQVFISSLINGKFISFKSGNKFTVIVMFKEELEVAKINETMLDYLSVICSMEFIKSKVSCSSLLTQ